MHSTISSRAPRRTPVAAGFVLRWAPVETRLFRGLAVLSPRGLCRLQLLNKLPAAAEFEIAQWARMRFPVTELRRDDAALAPLAEELRAYAAGRRRSFDHPLDLRGTPFQLEVWRGLLGIPYGAVESYGGLAERIGHARASRAVGAANGANPVPILVPCHRVVAGTSIGGFGLGLAMKRALLELEGVRGYELGTSGSS